MQRLLFVEQKQRTVLYKKEKGLTFRWLRSLITQHLRIIRVLIYGKSNFIHRREAYEKSEVFFVASVFISSTYRLRK